jgi:integrase
MASIRERTSKAGETTWSVLYRHGKRQTSKSFNDPKSAEKFKVLIETFGPEEALRLLSGDIGPAGIAVADLWEQFIAWKGRPVEKGGVTKRTLKDYERDYGNWIEPWFAHREADAIDERDVQRWVDHMGDKLAPKSVADRHMLLHQMYDFGKARTRRLVAHNPCEETSLPKRTKKPPKGTTVAEFAAIQHAAREAKGNPDAADLILFLGETGWRFSEATALHVRNVEDDGTDVWVTVGQVTRIDGQGRQYLAEDSAKSWAGFRRIRLFPDSAAMIRRRLVGKGPGDLVFLNRLGNHWNQNTWLRTTWPGIIAAANLGDRKPTPHWLRHMHVAVLAAAGTPPQEIQRRIGHESIQTTMGTYGGMIGDVSDETLSRAAEIMSGKRHAPGVAPVVRGEVVTGELD